MAEVNIQISRKLLLRRVMLGALAYILKSLKGVITMPVFARLLGPAGLGAVSLATTTTNLVWPLLTLGLAYALPVRILSSEKSGEIRTLYGSALNLITCTYALVVSVVLVARGVGFGAALIDRYVPFLFATSVYVLATLSREMALLLPRVLQRVGTTVVYELTIEYGGALLAIMLLVLGYGPSGLIWGLALSTLAISAILISRNVREFGFLPRIDVAAIRPLLRIGLPTVLVSLFQWGLQGMDYYFVVRFHGEALLGIYSSAYTVAGLTLGVSAVVHYVYFPTIKSVLNKQGRAAFEEFLGLVMRLCSLLLGLWLLATVILGKDIVLLLAGAPYAEAAKVVPLVVLGYTALTIANLLQVIPVALAERTSHMVWVYGCGFGVNLGLNYLLIGRYGLIGAAISTASSYVLVLILMILAASPFISLRRGGGFSLTGLVPVALLLPVALWCGHWATSLSHRLLSMAVIAACYVGVAFAAGAITRNDFGRMNLWETR